MTAALLFLRSELARHRRGWATVALIALTGIAISVAAAAGAQRTVTSFERFREVSKEPHALLASEGKAPAPVTPEQVERIDGVEVVGEAAAYILGFTERGLTPGLQMVVIAAGDERVFRDVYVPRVIEGRLPDRDAPDEITVNESLLRDLDLRVGEKLLISGPSPEQFGRIIEVGEPVDEYDGPQVEVTVVGVTRTTSNLEDMTFQTYEALAPYAFHRAIDAEAAVGARLTAVRLAHGDEAAGAFLDDVDPLVPDDGPQFEVNYLSGTDGINGAIRIQAVGLAIFAAIALLATLIAVSQAVARQQSLATTDALILRAIGLRRSDVVAVMVLPALAVIAVAALAGALVAVAMSTLLPFGIARRAEPTPGVRLDLLHLVMPALTVLTIAAVEALRLARVVRDTRPETRPVVARPHATPTAASGILRRAGSIPPIEMGIRFALQRTGRAFRGASGLVAAAFAIAAITATAIVATTVSFVSDDERASGFPWDHKVALGPVGQLEEEARAIVEPAADTMTVSSEGYAGVNGRPTFLTGLRHLKGVTDLVLFAGDPPRDANEILLGRDVANELGVGVGDEVDVSGHPFRVTAVGIVPIINSDQRHSGAVVTHDGYRVIEPRESETDGRALLVAWSEDGATVQRTMAHLEEAEMFHEPPFRPTDLDNLKQIGGIPEALVVFLALVSVAAVAHALMTVSRARRLDLAALRALGFTKPDVRWTVNWQGWTMGALSSAFGIPLGIAVGRAAWTALADTLKTVAPAQTPPPLLLVGPAALTIVFLVSFPIGWRAANRDVAATLRTE